MNKLFLWILLIFFSVQINGQSFEQLQQQWYNSSDLNAKINAGIELHDKFYRQADDSITSKTKLLESLYRLSVNSKKSNGIIYSSFYLGNCYIFMNNTPMAIKYYLISLKEAERTQSKIEIARAQMGIGLVHFTLNNFPMAMRFFKTSLALNKQLKNEYQISKQLYLIGFSLNSVNDFNSARNYLDSAIALKTKNNDTIGLFECKLALANTYKGQKNYDSAIALYRSLISKFIGLREWFPVANIYI